MIDLHTHSTFSDGELIPAELVRRARNAGYEAIAITDHGDAANLEFILSHVSKLAKVGHFFDMTVLAGVELTHMPPGLIGEYVEKARALGAEIVVVHGETVVEPVAAGTNLAAIEAGVDILAHPGLISELEVKLAAEKGVALEITTRGRPQPDQRSCGGLGPQARGHARHRQRRARPPRSRLPRAAPRRGARSRADAGGIRPRRSQFPGYRPEAAATLTPNCPDRAPRRVQNTNEFVPGLRPAMMR